MKKPHKVLLDRNLDPEKDLKEDCLVLAIRKNTSRIVLPAGIKRETRYAVPKVRQNNR